MAYTGGLGSAGDNWATDLFSTPNSTTEPQQTDGGGGFIDTVGQAWGTITGTASDWLGKYLQYQSVKDQRKFELQKAQQEAMLKTVERDQQTGAVPFQVTSANALPGLGMDNNTMLLIAIVAGLSAVSMLVKK